MQIGSIGVQMQNSISIYLLSLAPCRIRTRDNEWQWV